ncbi:MAG: ATP-dependent Clp protease adaptor ClpS [Phycisphaerales bacterium]|nr:ATP-dependent Clp protease adaptor ClpS [Phycisphaerales bacterium]
MAQQGSSSQPSPHAQGGPTGSSKQPARWNVVLLNDDDHSFDYVIRMVQELFYQNHEQAQRIAETIDSSGRAVVFTTHKEHAELKVEQIHGYGRDPMVSQSKGSMAAVIEPAE